MIIKTFMCSECGKVFKSKYSVKDHEVEKHGRTARYSCFVCEKGFYNRHVMLSHVVVHDDTRSLKEHADDKEHQRIMSKSESKESKSVRAE